MKANVYRINNDTGQAELDQIELDKGFQELSNDLHVIEKEIISEYLSKQKDNIGIKNLGNELRYNMSLKKLFNNRSKEFVIVKLTENRRSFVKILIDAINDFQPKDIFFFILENDFGMNSKLVDSSFIRKDEITEELNKIINFFEPKFELSKLYVIEMKGFKNYRVEVIEEGTGYSKIHENK